MNLMSICVPIYSLHMVCKSKLKRKVSYLTIAVLNATKKGNYKRRWKFWKPTDGSTIQFSSFMIPRNFLYKR